MPVVRQISSGFWEDTDIVDNYTAEDKYFFLYCLTNPHSNLLGCYEISIKQMANELDWSKEQVEKVLYRFIEVHQRMKYDNDSKELLVINWCKYNWSMSPKCLESLLKNLELVKNDTFHDLLLEMIENRYPMDTVSIPYTYRIARTYSNTNIISIFNSITNTKNNNLLKEENKNKEEIPFEEIINYLNEKIGTRYLSTSTKTRDLIRARWNQGFRLEDFYTVIDKKVNDWFNDNEMKVFLRPETLFSNKFESYLNQLTKKKTTKDLVEVLDFSRFTDGSDKK